MSELQGFQRPKRAVAIRRDGDDFVVSLMPNDHVIYRNEAPQRCGRSATSYVGRS
jgi:hypothetical protein